MTTAIVRSEPEAIAPNLFGTPDPAAALVRITEYADALKDVLDKQKLTSMISGRRHVSVEGWTLLGSMLGVFPVCQWTRPVLNTEGNRVGWEARVEAVTRAGEIVGAAESMCTTRENQWKSRDDYALRSMAQTRATSKALRQPLGFIVVLAGYEGTPEEEMPESAGPAVRKEAISGNAAKENPLPSETPASDGEPERPGPAANVEAAEAQVAGRSAEPVSDMSAATSGPTSAAVSTVSAVPPEETLAYGEGAAAPGTTASGGSAGTTPAGPSMPHRYVGDGDGLCTVEGCTDGYREAHERQGKLA
jgi:hypothetical protein